MLSKSHAFARFPNLWPFDRSMGTGIVKVWNLTKDLWERELSGT